MLGYTTSMDCRELSSKLEREPKRIEVADAGDMAYEVGTYEVSWEEPKNRGAVRPQEIM